MFFFFDKMLDFVEEMFQYLNIKYQKDVSVSNEQRTQAERVDFVLKSNNGLDILVEVKEVRDYFNNVVDRAYEQIKYERKLYEKEKLSADSFIIVFGNVDKNKKIYLKRYKMIIIDLPNILYLIKDNQDLIERLNNILPYSIIDISPQKIDLEKYINFEKHIENKESIEIPKSIKIEDEYIEEIKRLEKGKEESTEFQDLGEKILKLLFGDYLYDWKSQVCCDNNWLRMDLVGKIKRQDGFWKMLYEIYKTRYIAFEFKNYNDEISGSQIDDTNKYLHDKALRTVAIVVSREKANKSAKERCKGILRNEGNLILRLDQNDLITMLEKRRDNDNKDITTEYMEKIFDVFLLELEK